MLKIPTISIAGLGDVPETVQAMKAGAVEFLTKPFGDDVAAAASRIVMLASHTPTAFMASFGPLR